MFNTTINLISLGALPAFLLLDLVFRHRQYKRPRFWRPLALVVSVFTVVVAVQVTLGWARLVGDHTLLNLSGLGIWAGAAVGILVYEFFHYWYHRTAHHPRGPFRRWHQMHHAPEANDAWGANFAHPIDTFMFITLSSLVFFPLLGLAPAAGAVAGAFLAFNAAFQHANIRTPRWLGYLIQRPESHSVHHGRGYHRNNYADLPLWDIVFGTFENPAEPVEACGYWDGASYRIGDMLLGRSIVKPPADQAEKMPTRAYSTSDSQPEQDQSSAA